MNPRKDKKVPVWSDPTDGETPPPLYCDHISDVNEDEVDDRDEDEDDVDMYANDVRSSRDTLETRELRFKHLVDINSTRKKKHDIVHDIAFHPSSRMAMVILNKGRIDLFEIDGERNSHLHRIKTPYAQRQNAQFKLDGREIVLASEIEKGKFYCYDMCSGKSVGHWLRIGDDLKQISDFELSDEHMLVRESSSREILVLSSKTYEIVSSITINDPVAIVKFQNNNEIMIAGENNRIYSYDLRKSSLCKHKFQDEGTVHISSLGISTASNLLSVGSDCGIVNTYSLSDCLENKTPKPLRSHSNLATSVGLLKYNHSGELLLMASKAAHAAFRLVHSYSGTVYRNFPSKDHKYGHPAGIDFSPMGGYLALGCTNGQANLIRIPFYTHY